MSSRILKPAGDRRGAISSKRSRRIMKKPLIGSLSDVPSTRWVIVVARRLIVPRLSPKDVRAAAFDVARGGDEIDALPSLKRREHLRQHGLVMLQIGIHHRDEGRAGRQHAFDAGAREAAASDAAEAAHARIAPRRWP